MNILITGITSGIGLALMKELANYGHAIIGCGRDLSKLNNLELVQPHNHLLSQIDVSNDILVKQWANEVYKIYNKIDIIINNAGVKSQLLPIWEITTNDFDQTIKINVLGIVNIIRHFVPKMVKNKQGIIINVTSEWGKYADAYVSSYCASKFAVEGITQSLAKELPHGMASVALNPYFVRTELLESCKELFLPGEYELSISPDEWAKFAVPKLLAIDYMYNGKHITLHPLASNN
jgi:NADP-dependent 3-hydroxy acid dehydrogenase YdfG